MVPEVPQIEQATYKYHYHALQSHHVLVTSEETDYPIRHHCRHLRQQVAIVTDYS